MEEARYEFRDAGRMVERIKEMQGQATILGSGSWNIAHLPQGHTGILEVVYIDPNDTQLVYTISGKQALTYQAIMRIAHGAGIRWISGKSGRTDDGSNPDIVGFRSVCAFKGIDGVEREYEGHYTLNFAARREQLASKKGDARAAQEILNLKVFGVERAESGAKKRAVCSALSLKASGLDGHELVKKPYIIPRAVVDLDMNDPVIRWLVTAKELGIDLGAFFGGGRSVASLAGQGSEAPALPPSDDPAAPALPPSDEADPGLPTGDEFKELTRAEREAWVKSLFLSRECERGEDRARHATYIRDLSDEKLRKWYDYLIGQPIVAPEVRR